MFIADMLVLVPLNETPAVGGLSVSQRSIPVVALGYDFSAILMRRFHSWGSVFSPGELGRGLSRQRAEYVLCN